VPIAHVIVSLVLAALFISTGGSKIFGGSASRANRERLGVGAPLWWTTATLEWLAAAGLIVGVWLPLAGLAASVGIVLLMIAAIVVRARAKGDQRAGIAADVIVLVIALMSIVFAAQALGA
jgi:uncharacterized membrane protein YphA (DoxX/SURF4 family)